MLVLIPILILIYGLRTFGNGKESNSLTYLAFLDDMHYISGVLGHKALVEIVIFFVLILLLIVIGVIWEEEEEVVYLKRIVISILQMCVTIVLFIIVHIVATSLIKIGFKDEMLFGFFMNLIIVLVIIVVVVLSSAYLIHRNVEDRLLFLKKTTTDYLFRKIILAEYAFFTTRGVIFMLFFLMVLYLLVFHILTRGDNYSLDLWIIRVSLIDLKGYLLECVNVCCEDFALFLSEKDFDNFKQQISSVNEIKTRQELLHYLLVFTLITLARYEDAPISYKIYLYLIFSGCCFGKVFGGAFSPEEVINSSG